MKTSNRSLFGLVLVALLATCSSNDSESPGSGTLSAKGQSCQSSADCAAGLACVRNVCGVVNYGLTPTGKKCLSVECSVPADCCPKPSTSCANYLTMCEAGISYQCQYYQQYCVCDASKYGCEQNKCKRGCSPAGIDDAGIIVGSSCGSLQVCANGWCVECNKDADCLNAGKVASCVQNVCVTKCTTKNDCKAFFDCQNSACVEVGCATNRECIASTGNALSVCQDKKCLVPCQTDVECSSSSIRSLQACINGQCTDVGCETDEECRILNPSTTLLTNQRWICQAP
jgi:hypothetical protein